jgi:hypothetical protein
VRSLDVLVEAFEVDDEPPRAGTLWHHENMRVETGGSRVYSDQRLFDLQLADLVLNGQPLGVILGRDNLPRSPGKRGWTEELQSIPLPN